MTSVITSAPPVYGVPVRFLNGRLADMLFWDAVFYLLAVRGEWNEQGHHFVETTHAEMAALTGLTHRTLRQKLDLALANPDPYRLHEEDGIIAHGRILKFRQWRELNSREKIILKPAGFMNNGWAWVLSQPYPGESKTARFPLAILNRLLMKPPGRATTRAELIQRTRQPGRKKLPDTGDVNQALAHLLALRLIEQTEPEEFQVCREQFAIPAQRIWQQVARSLLSSPEPDKVQQARQLDAPRAAQALRLAELGQFDLDRHFNEIFYDLSRFRLETDLPHLEYVVYRNRRKPAAADRWQNCIIAFERRLAQQSGQVASEKVTFDLRAAPAQTLKLALPPDERQLRWGKLVIWYEDRRFAFSGQPVTREPVLAQLHLGETTLWERALTYETGVIHHDLTAPMQNGATAFFLSLSAGAPLPQVVVTAMLEAQYLADTA